MQHIEHWTIKSLLIGEFGSLNSTLCRKRSEAFSRTNRRSVLSTTVEIDWNLLHFHVDNQGVNQQLLLAHRKTNFDQKKFDHLVSQAYSEWVADPSAG
ncbi:hypothetical protein [Rhodopirellula islandica]|uniref:hypothetical protein n=1 Tax=Rhodopirellula islandica TaxID=595434 RepID=UPI00123746D2|nr:hypothetical protein [Rhodopirellula islandica]